MTLLLNNEEVEQALLPEELLPPPKASIASWPRAKL